MRRGFTLLELLVVIGVISALLGLAAPALMGARESGRMAVCASNARQLQLANDLFAEEHDGRYAPGAAEFFTNNRRWHGVRDPETGAFRPSVRREEGRLERAPLTEYLAGDGSSEAVRACPTFAPVLAALEREGRGFESGSGGYGYNNAFVGVERVRRAGVWEVADDSIGSRRSAFWSPSRTLAFADAALAVDAASTGVHEHSFIEPRRWPQFPAATPDPTTHFRHKGAANVAWLDGHVSREAMTATWTSGLYSDDAGAANVGWFGDDSNALWDYD